MMKTPSLRELKKEATARALSDAAFALALERGLDGMVIEDIVERAGYSRRTFANHYACKEEAVAMAAFPYHGIEEFMTILNELPQHATPLDVAFSFLTMQLTIDFLARMRQLMVLADKYRTLEPYLLIVLRRLQTEMEELLSELFDDRYPEGYNHLLTGAVSEALLPIMDGSVDVEMPGQTASHSTEAMNYDDYLQMIFTYLRHGL